MKVLVTGATGYIGAHVCKQLHQAGHNVIAIDKTFHQNNIVKYCTDLIKFNIGFEPWMGAPLKVDAVIHLAAYISVEESTQHAVDYYENNIRSCRYTLTEFVEYKHFIFASTGAAFDPQNPYAISKIVSEAYVKEIAFNCHTIFRFFNVSGLDTEFSPTGTPTHLIRRAAMAARGKIPALTIFGSDFDTRDGTCIRDYVHVIDLANTIVRVVEAGPQNTPYECVGSGTGFTVKEIIHAMEAVTGQTLNTNIGLRRAGDAPITLTPSVTKFMKTEHSIGDMCRSAYEFEGRT